MFWSMAPLVVACIVLARMPGHVLAFQAGGPGVRSGSRNSISGRPAGRRRHPEDPDPDAPAARGLAAQLRQSSRHRRRSRRCPTASTAARVSSRIGYLAPTGKYLSLTQSNADEAALVASIKPDSYASGTQDVDGVTWVVYESSDPEPVWTTKLSGPAQGGDHGRRWY